jgi:hypothetical protein
MSPFLLVKKQGGIDEYGMQADYGLEPERSGSSNTICSHGAKA